MKAIIIAGMPAAGKTTVSHILSDRLGLPIVGGTDILKELAKKHGYAMSGEDWWDTPDGMRFTKEREGDPEFDKEADRILLDRISEGNVIVTSYTAPWISKSGFKIWLAATFENRAERMAKRDNTPLADTEKTTKKRDIENYKIYKNLYNFEYGRDLKPFDLIIDTDRISPEEVAKKIIARIKELKLDA